MEAPASNGGPNDADVADAEGRGRGMGIGVDRADGACGGGDPTAPLQASELVLGVRWRRATAATAATAGASREADGMAPCIAVVVGTEAARRGDNDGGGGKAWEGEAGM